MKTIILILCFFQIIDFSFSQNIENEGDKFPEINFQESSLEYNNFPAISENGRFIALIHQEYSCCIETHIVFKIFDTKTGKPVTSILLCASPESNMELPETTQIANVKIAQNFLYKRKYLAMQAIENFKQINLQKLGKVQVEIPYYNKTLKSQAFDLNSQSMHPYCCNGNVDSKEPCFLWAKLNKVWLDTGLRYLLIEQGVNDAADGCDFGPSYSIVWLFK